MLNSCDGRRGRASSWDGSSLDPSHDDARPRRGAAHPAARAVGPWREPRPAATPPAVPRLRLPPPVAASPQPPADAPTPPGTGLGEVAKPTTDGAVAAAEDGELRAAVRELRRYRDPPPAVQRVARAALLLLGDASARKTWAAARCVVARADFATRLRDRRPVALSGATFDAVQSVVAASRRGAAASKVAAPLQAWVERQVALAGPCREASPPPRAPAACPAAPPTVRDASDDSQTHRWCSSSSDLDFVLITHCCEDRKRVREIQTGSKGRRQCELRRRIKNSRQPRIMNTIVAARTLRLPLGVVSGVGVRARAWRLSTRASKRR